MPPVIGQRGTRALAQQADEKLLSRPINDASTPGNDGYIEPRSMQEASDRIPPHEWDSPMIHDYPGPIETWCSLNRAITECFTISNREGKPRSIIIPFKPMGVTGGVTTNNPIWLTWIHSKRTKQQTGIDNGDLPLFFRPSELRTLRQIGTELRKRHGEHLKIDVGMQVNVADNLILTQLRKEQEDAEAMIRLQEEEIAKLREQLANNAKV